MLKTRRFLMVLGVLSVLACAFIFHNVYVGPLPRLLDHIGGFAVFGTIVLGTAVPALTLVDKVTRKIAKPLRSWAWLLFSVVFVGVIWMALVISYKAFVAAASSRQ